MEKKLDKKPQVNKQKKNKTEVERYVDKALTWGKVGEKQRMYRPNLGTYGDAITLDLDFGDCPYDLSASGTDIDSVVKKINEMSTYNAIKNNKRFKEAVDLTARNLAASLIESTVDTQKQIEKDKIYEEKQRKIHEVRDKKIAIANAKIAEKAAIAKAKLDEKRAKEEAQKNIFKEGLTASQKKAIKKFYGFDIK